MESITEKRCCRCKEWKAYSEFGKDRSRKDGHTNECRACRKLAQQKWQREHPDRVNDFQRNWRRANSEKFKAIEKRYRDKNSEKIKNLFQRWYEANREKELERKKRYHAENKEKERAYRLANRERETERVRKHREKNPERYREHSYLYYLANKTKILARNKLWEINNPDKIKAKSANRRARKNGNGGKITAKEWQELKEKYSYTCLRCRRQEPEIKLTLDHVKPLVMGGENKISNAQPLCLSCNDRKGIRHIDYR